MLSTDYRAASALMSRRHRPVKDYELMTAVKEARRENALKNIELPPVGVVRVRPTTRTRALLNRLGIAGT
jgi:hypothetical protein